MHRIFILSCLLLVVVKSSAQVIQSPDAPEEYIVEGLKCDFEFGVCGLKGREEDNSASRLHLVESGADEDPRGDHTTGNGTYYAFSLPEEDMADYSKFATLTLSKLTEGHTYCFSFWFYNNGGLLIIMEHPNRFPRFYTDCTEEWQQAEMTIEGSGKELRLRLLFPNGTFGRVSIDDLELKVGACKE